jgi:transposase-like protein
VAPNRKSSDAGSASKPKRSRVVLSNSEKVKILDMIEIKKTYAEIARLHGKNKSSIREEMKNKEKIPASFSVAPQTAVLLLLLLQRVINC